VAVIAYVVIESLRRPAKGFDVQVNS